MKKEKFLHTRKPLHGQRPRVVGGSFRATEESAATGCRRQSGETTAQRIGANQHLPAEVGGDWELRLGLQRSDPRERIGVGCMNTA